ncbi:riboflavin kinase/FMN adenylyltransferase [Neobacillus niacini]|uniref:FAD synthetase family protein n=1 Tax=Neobacillus niacini TaxID=86668 RepID=UPI00277EDAC4|nr:FAD synthetase family protein [Neobacillus niacini]MDQ1005207.1 riboflavin kinase/FMN adenylyltransferase [Neobacillus niacini]
MQTLYINSQNRGSFLEVIKPGVAALGFFDGVHLGHQQVIKTAVKMAKKRNIQSIVMTFSPHPKEVLGNQKVDYLTSIETKKEIFQKLGVDVLYLIEFNREFAVLKPWQFAQNYLVDFQIQHVVAGFDFTYGFRGQGNMETIVADGLGCYGATVIEKIHFKNEKISSTRIRMAIQHGNLSDLPNLLGDFYRTNGVIRNVKKGMNICEINVHERCLLPNYGEYEVEAEIDGFTFRTIVYRIPEDPYVLYMLFEKQSVLPRHHQMIKLKWIDVSIGKSNKLELEII